MKSTKNTDYDFEERKHYEETFVANNSELLMKLTGASTVMSMSRSVLDRLAGIDALLQIGRDIVGVALRVRKPQYKAFAKRFTLGFHESKVNSQVHTILNSRNAQEQFVPHLLIQVNGVDDEGYCTDCTAIMIQTNIFCYYLEDLKQTNQLESYYIPKLDAYEFGMADVWHQTDTGVDLFEIKDNEIIKVYAKERSSKG